MIQIRPANLVDLNRCLKLDDSFDTEYVWQMEQSLDSKEIAVRFRLARLPRAMKVSDVVSEDDVAFHFMHGGTLLVAEDGTVRGFIDVTESEWNQALHINNLAVAPAFRRKGIGTQLMQAALDWARQKKLRVALLSTSTKAYPAISFFQKHGFGYCGYNDQLYPNRDIAMLFALNLR